MTKQTIPNDKPLMCKIIDKWEECFETYGFKLQLPIKVQGAKPGQFIMLWVPGEDEYPVGIAGLKDNVLEIGVGSNIFSPQRHRVFLYWRTGKSIFMIRKPIPFSRIKLKA